MVYKIRVILNTDEDVFRDIEIKSTQTLWNLQEGIKSAFSLRGEEMASFYYSDDNWTQGQEIPLEDISDDGDGETMSDVYIKDAFSTVGIKMLFIYDFMLMWSFYVELLEIVDKKPIGNYPLTTYRFGKMPLKAPDRQFKSVALDDFGDVNTDDMDFNDELDSFDDDDLDDGYDMPDSNLDEE